MGIVRYASNNVPRFDHDPTTGESLGLLIEESRINKFSYSSEFTNDAWENVNMTEIADQIVAPDGTTTADKVSSDATATEARYIKEDLSITNGVTYTQSVFAKAGEVTIIQIAPSTGFLSRYQNFDLSTGQLGTGNVAAATITAYPNGWYRCTVTETAITTSSSGRMVMCLVAQSNSGRITSPSFNLGDGLYLWGAQLEEGAFATSYIPTSGSTVTRAADTAIIKGTNFTDWYNETESTIHFESSIASSTAAKYFTFHGVDGGGTELIEAAATSGPGANIFTYANSTTYANISVTDSDATTIKYAAGIKANDINLAVNGTLGTADTSSTQPDALDKLIIGNYSSGNYYINTSIKKLSYYNRRLPDAQLQGLTQQ